MKLVALLALMITACGSSSPSSDAGDAGDAADTAKTYPVCPQHRVEPFECNAPADAADPVLMKDGLRCASCSGVDDMGKPTDKPLGCVTVANDLCVASCGECS